MKKNTEKSLWVNKKPKNGYILGTIIAIYIALSPYFFYLYENIPNTRIWETYLFAYDAKSWQEANFAMWVLVGKVLPLTFVFIWFLTCRHWWYHALIVPITMYTYQVIVFFNDNITYIDEFQLIHLIPVMAIIIPSIYLVRARIFNRINTVNKSTQELEDELTFRPNTLWGKIKQFF
ncbi:hypothetical protein [Lacinutrix mariniflava]|uniref:hypothetical protein n=1 Tax=Lacinutrix mariniflava TaxID=342955 RepID=UPI000AD941C7|nr:hypothetical protein [Lacinutrix mariniflava]